MAYPQGTTTVVVQQPYMVGGQQSGGLVDLRGSRDWNEDMLGCLSDLCGCLYGYFCAPCLSCDIAYSLDEWTWFVVCCGNFPALRAKFRYQAGIQGSLCFDMLIGCLCMPCAMCQLKREMEQMGVLKYFQSEALSEYILLAVTLERVLALYHPFRARTWATPRNACLTLASILALSAGCGAVAFVVYDLRPSAYFLSSIGCFSVVDHLSSFAAFVIFNFVLNLILPTLLLLVLTFILRAKIYRVGRVRLELAPRSMSLSVNSPTAIRGNINLNINQLARRSSNPSRGNISRNGTMSQSQNQQRSQCRRSDVRIASAVFMLSLVEVLFYLPFVLVWLVYNLLDYTKSASEVRHLLGTLGRIVSTSMIVTRMWNLYIYLATVSIFRREFVRLFCRFCKCRGRRARAESPEGRAEVAALQVSQPRSTLHAAPSRLSNSRSSASSRHG